MADLAPLTAAIAALPVAVSAAGTAVTAALTSLNAEVATLTASQVPQATIDGFTANVNTAIAAVQAITALATA